MPRIGKIASLETGVAASLSGVKAISPQADMTFGLWRKASEATPSLGNAFQVNGLPITSASTTRDMYAATQMKQVVGTAGHIYGTNATRKPDGIKIINPGEGYAVDNTFHLICNGWAATTTPHDAVVTVVAVHPNGGIKDFTIAEVAGTHTYTLGLATGAPALTAPSATTTHTPAVFEITALGSDSDPAVFKTTAAVVTAIDVHADDILDHETYKVWVAGGSLDNKVEPVGAWVEYEVSGTTGAISDGHISTITGTYTVGQVLNIEEGGVDLGGRFTIVSIDESNDIVTGYISARGAGYTVADNKVLTNAAGIDQAARFDVTQIDDFVVSSGVVTFHIPTVSGTISRAPVGMKKLPAAGDWLKCVAYLTGQLVFTNTSALVGATPTAHANSSSTGAKIVQVACPIAGAVKTIAIKSATGTYAANDILTLVQEGGSGCKIKVVSVDGSFDITDIALLEGGSGYSIGDDLAATGGEAGTATFTVSAVATAGEYITRTVTHCYALSGTGNLVVTFTDGAKVPAGNLVRMSHTFALWNKVAITSVIDPAAHVPEVYKVTYDGTVMTVTTHYTIGSGVINITTTTPPTVGVVVQVYVLTGSMTCVAGDEITFEQGASGGYVYSHIIPSADMICAIAYDDSGR
jgi:hypothetical protein